MDTLLCCFDYDYDDKIRVKASLMWLDPFRAAAYQLEIINTAMVVVVEKVYKLIKSVLK